MISHAPIWSLIFLSCLFLCFVKCASSKQGMISLLTLAILWNVGFALGISWNGAKILVILNGILWFMHPETIPKIKEPKIRLSLLLICAYVLIITGVGSAIEKDLSLNAMQSSIFQKAPLRGLIATGFWFIGPCCFLIGYGHAVSSRVVETLVKVLLIAFGVAAAVGAIQFVAYYTFPGLERILSFFSPIANDAAITAELEDNAFGWYRPSPFCAEPRYFSLMMAIAAATVFLSRRFLPKAIPKYLNHIAWLPVYLGLCFAGGSTSSIGGAILAFGGMILWLSFIRKKRSRLMGGNATTIAMLAVSVFAIFMIEARTNMLSRRLDYYLQSYGLRESTARTTGNDQHNSAVTAYIAWLSDSPICLFFGAGPGNAAFYVYKYASASTTGEASAGMILNTRFPVLDSIASIGIFGFALQLSAWWVIWKMSKSRNDSMATDDRLLFLRGFYLFLMVLFVSCYSDLLIWLVGGMLLRLSNQSKLIYLRPIQRTPVDPI